MLKLKSVLNAILRSFNALLSLLFVSNEKNTAPFVFLRICAGLPLRALWLVRRLFANQNAYLCRSFIPI